MDRAFLEAGMPGFSVLTLCGRGNIIWEKKGRLSLTLIKHKGKEQMVMATSTFDRKIEITDPDSVRRLLELAASDEPVEPLSEHPYSYAERDRSERLLRQFLSR